MIETGAKAPDFTLPDQDGNEVTFSKLKGKTVVLHNHPAPTRLAQTHISAFRREYVPACCEQEREMGACDTALVAVPAALRRSALCRSLALRPSRDERAG